MRVLSIHKTLSSGQRPSTRFAKIAVSKEDVVWILERMPPQDGATKEWSRLLQDLEDVREDEQ